MRPKPGKDQVQKILGKLYGHPCWDARKGYGSFLTFEFGKPLVTIDEPVRSWNGKPRVRPAATKRGAWVHGEWHLWIYCCRWTIHQDGKRLATSSSGASKMGDAARQLQGQALIGVSVDPKSGDSRFEFDYGGRLETRRWDRTDVQWILHSPTHRVLEIRGDGKYSDDHETTRCNDTEWKQRSADWELL